jgi:hypothetical protein
MAACGAVGRGFKSLWARFNLLGLLGARSMQYVVHLEEEAIQNQIKNKYDKTQ